MKAKLPFSLLLLCAFLSSSVYAQTTIGGQKVDQYPVTAAGALTYGLTYVPADYDPAKKYPLIIFLHGSGEGGNGVSGLNNLCNQGLPWWIARGFKPSAVSPVDGKTYEFIVCSPQAPAFWQWSYDFLEIQYMLPDILNRYSIDQSRIYVTGLSAGGAGTWSCVTHDPAFARKIAAIMPNSDAGLNNTPVEGPFLKDITSVYGVPVWCVDGALDGLHGHTTLYLDTINAGPPIANPQGVQTLIAGAGHSAAAWDSAYSPTWRNNVFNQTAYEWFLRYQRSPAVLTAYAGANQSITLPTSTANLSGSGSPAAGNSISSYTWTELSGPNTATIGAPGSAATGISALIQGLYTFQLSVKDNVGGTATSTMTVTVNPAPNVPPTVNAGSTQTIQLPTNSVSLTGTATGNGGATISTTTWTETSGPNTAGFGSPGALTTTATGLIAGTYTFQLSAKDNNGLSATSSVTITVKAANVPPTVSAGSTQTITLPTSSVSLGGTATGNGGATISSTTWTETSGPNTAGFGSPGALTTTATGLIAGTYTFQLSATDNNGLSATSSVTITVKAANVPPTVSAGSTQTIQLPINSVSLVGTATGNGGATISSTTWTETSGPNTAGFGSPGALSSTATGLIAGTYTFQLSAIDNNGLSSTSSVTITVKAANVPPTVSAGSGQSITLPTNSASLRGTATGNGGATISSTAWTETSGPNTAGFGSPGALTTTATGLIAGTYTFQLSATDNNGLSATSSVTITVNAAIPPPPPPPPPPPNVPPTVNAGSTQTITLPTNSVSLTGTATGNGGATISSTTWTETSGPNTAGIGTPGSLSATATSLIAGTYTFQLSATDNNGLSATSSVTITVNAAIPPPPPANQPPVANAGPDQALTLPTSSTSLDGTASYDPDGNIASYSWMQISGPAGVSVTNSNTATPDIIGLQAASYVFQLTVTDNQGVSASAQVTITVSAAVQVAAPVANAGKDTTIAVPANTVVLNGMGSTDPGSSIVSYQWEQVSGPAAATLPTPQSAVSPAENLQVGSYVFRLKVENAQGDTAVSMVKVTVVSNLRTSGDHLFLYPNPAQDNVHLRITGDGTGVALVKIYDINGKLVMRTSEVLQAGFSETEINVSSLMKGMYTIHVITPDKKVSRIKMMKQ